MRKWMALLLAAALLMLCGCQNIPSGEHNRWSAGFGCVELPLPEATQEPLHIAGYRSGWEITGLLDAQQARAVWLSDGTDATVLIAVDCVGLGKDTVDQIRQKLIPFCRETGCGSVNVVATHSHAGVDTLGLWGPLGMDGKNSDFMEILVDGAVKAAQMAYADRSEGTLSYCAVDTADLQEDSRDPVVYDSKLYQIRFQPEDPMQNGIRLLSFAAHAEALRGDNTLVSRDYPGILCDEIYRQSGDDALFIPGAIGGLVMTPELAAPFDAEENARITGQKLAQIALSAETGRELSPELSISCVEFETELENTVFLYYQFLGILQRPVRQDLTGRYYLQTELTVLQLGDVTLALLPGEIFPELVSGTENPADPEALSGIAARWGVRDLVIVGLANDEIGYIVPPSDFVLDAQLPFLQEAPGDHYEETNSVGRFCAADVAKALEQALKQAK